MSALPTLLTVPNFSTASDAATVDEFVAVAEPLRLLATHSDADHGRTVLTLAGPQGEIAPALARMARVAAERIDITGHPGTHPHVGALDVAPVVYLSRQDRGAACAEALAAAHEIGERAAIPVFLYGDLAQGRERAELRAGGIEGLAGRIVSGDQQPDFGPSAPHPTAGATLVGARQPLVAFNFELHADHTLEDARSIAAQVREAGGGLPGVRAIGLWLDSRERAQVSCNVHDPLDVPLVRVLEEVSRRAQVTAAELVGLAPEAAFEGFPDELPVQGFDRTASLIENVIPS